MSAELNETHDPALESWVESANDPAGDFPLQNLPFGVFRRAGTDEPFGVGVAIGDQVLDLALLNSAKPFSGLAADALAACTAPELNNLMALGPKTAAALRLALSRALRRGASEQALLAEYLVPLAAAELSLPAWIGDFTDFYTSIHHATAVGRQFRPDNPLLPNYEWVPIGYHGRSSSIGVSGQRFPRPQGQVKGAADSEPALRASARLDYELEVGLFIGAGSAPGEPVALAEAEDHIFGLCLLNDWSARDLQAWEYQPLGPFLAKNFASTISPWVVTTEALAPYRLPWTREAGQAQPLPYLDSAENRAYGALDLELEVLLLTEQMRRSGEQPLRLSQTNFRHAFWTLAQLVAHHSVNGCNLCPGDLLGTGTQSGPNPVEAGSLLELSQGGTTPLALSNGESRTFLEDGDTVILRGYCAAPGRARIGFGEASGTVLPARA